ncbi:uncharacterized protein LOC132742155 [Ruditapes philippinarum]|uniref:uncharacterized protein LOC132742155 n=1 Tax=Ruditapes philippinarum TaxID=129788 RepID=UPI00295BD9B1|nr:uncharacterized protein LOC132742155 [Ruditapes philippinarum]
MVGENGDADVPTPNKYFRTFNDDMAVQEYGKILLEYLSSKPDSTTVNRQRLDDDFVNFESKCRQNKAVYYAAYPNVTRICEKVFITPADRAAHYDINNKSKADLQSIIKSLLQEIRSHGGHEEAEYISKQWAKKLRCGTKNVLLTVYQELCQCLEEVASREQTLESDSESQEDGTTVAPQEELQLPQSDHPSQGRLLLR